MTDTPGVTLPAFERTRLGYHREQVDDFVRTAIGRIQHLEARLREASGSGASRAMVGDLLKTATAEISEREARGRDEITRMTEKAFADAAQVTRTAQEDAHQLLAAAQEQADAILAAARESARSIITAAETETIAVRDGSQQRVALLTGRHAEALRRLTEIRDVVGGLVAAEQNRGPLEEEVDAATRQMAVQG